jgi:hypothetical protein
MRKTEPKKVVYLFGAGATHAELQNTEPDLIDKNQLGLLVSHVSSRVIEKARRDQEYLRDVAMVSGTSGSLNIELLISLIENSKVHGWDEKSRYLKKLVREDIKGILTAPRVRRFYLHKALLELHKHKKTIAREKLLGLISLNYDDVLDKAYKAYYGQPNYCFSLADTPQSDHIPLLKLHGSFNWRSQLIRGWKRNIEIIPMGATKNYLHSPYCFIWNRALEILIGCDTLRVIGCSLSQNDVHLIDLLFKAHLERGTAFDIEIIGSEKAGFAIQANYGFFPGVKTITQIEGTLIADPSPTNPFKTWLKYKSTSLLGRDMKKTSHLHKVAR